MSQFFRIHPDNPQLRLLRQAAQIIAEGGIIVYPTDSTYALACAIGDKEGLERIRRLRALPADHHLTLVCRDLSQLSTFARVDNPSYRLIRRYLPGPYTLLLPASREVPRRLLHPKRKTIGLRVPDNVIALGLLAQHEAPLMSTTMRLPGDDLPLADAEEIRERVQNAVDLVIDGGPCGIEPTTVIDLSSEQPALVRAGKGVWP